MQRLIVQAILVYVSRLMNMQTFSICPTQDKSDSIVFLIDNGLRWLSAIKCNKAPT